VRESGVIPVINDLPGELYFRHDQLAAMEWQTHSHSWGQLNYVSFGVMNLEINGIRYLSPPQYAIWIPPNVEHFSYTLQEAIYRSVYIGLETSARLPLAPCTMSVSPVLRAIFDDFALRDIRSPETEQDIRMAQVALDQILNVETHDNYLPYASSEELNRLLRLLQDNPGDKRSVRELASTLHTTSRSLERRCQRELGMSFGEWRLRLKFMYALECLDAGHTVQSIALDLGYSTTSAFIVMFRRFTGTSPDQYRTTRRMSQVNKM